MNLSDLLARCRVQDVKAQRLVYERYAGRLFRVAQRYMKDRMEAEDMLVSAFQRIFEHLKKFEYKDEAATWVWMKTILVNQCLMELRRSANFTMVPENEAPDQPFTYSILDEIAAETIQKVIMELPIGYRTVFNLVALEGYTHTEVAKQLQISEGTSKSQLNKARQLLQKKLQALGYAAQTR